MSKKRMSKTQWEQYQASLKLANKMVRLITHKLYLRGDLSILANNKTTQKT